MRARISHGFLYDKGCGGCERIYFILSQETGGNVARSRRKNSCVINDFNYHKGTRYISIWVSSLAEVDDATYLKWKL